ncbi:DUF885 domain-containing protein [Pseudoalteromonas luteoviolacea]|uniref:DUF885 domain-containing protein n=1 Tax=Pseudoalteromonas luteoviolacea H33 TaxID=1365251 RepID=A0A167GR97_9GAMM|nr:hypothetical protein N476_06720 [Pseudoalteromonas luteoviolacea H33]KZN77021.1 hypothetical protein N477_13670 [Pseudoalteromonas luteoviolacea H33-S]
MLNAVFKPLSAIALVLSLSACQMTQNNPDQAFVALSKQVMTFRADISANHTKSLDELFLLPDMSPAHLARENQRRLALLDKFDAIDTTQLSAENQINFAILRAQVQNKVDKYHFKHHYVPLLSESGFHTDMSFKILEHDFSTPQGYQQLIAQIKQLPRYFSQQMDWMRKGMAIGLTQPQVVLQGFESSIEAYIAIDDVERSPFYAPFKTNQAAISDEAFSKLQQQAKHAIVNYANPAYQSYLDFFVNEYRPVAKKDIAWSSTPNGEAFYINRAKHFTTTDMTPKQIHELGLQEVARIRSEMNTIIKKVGFEGSFAEFVEFLRTDPQFYAKTPEELLKEASFIAKKMDAKLPQFFYVSTLPRVPYGVAPVPDSLAPKYTTGRYLPPSKETDPGYYWVNTYALDKRPLYVLEALTLHEGVPGHHLQIAINDEFTHLPEYRNEYISAFGEGWGLYAEYLGLEAGFYQDPYSDFGRLTYEMWRAARLVVDTGMHMFGWSREQAMQFMQNNTALSLHNVKTETDRYISWPGQALSYKIGELTIRRLRTEAEQALGEQFNIREFHHQILKNGSVPLFVLEAQIAQYIEQAQKQK